MASANFFAKRPVSIAAVCLLAVLFLALWRKYSSSPIEHNTAEDYSKKGLFQERNARKVSKVGESQNEKEVGDAKGHFTVDFAEPFVSTVPKQKGMKRTGDVIKEVDVAKEQEGAGDAVLKNNQVKENKYALEIAPHNKDFDAELDEIPQSTNGQIDFGSTLPVTSSVNDEVTSLPTSSVNDEVTSLPPLPTFYPSKDLFVRAVYFDDRPRDGHRNTSVFLVVCIRNITDNNLIVGCQVDERQASEFSVKLIGETPLWRAFYNQINHEEVLVHCYDLPVKNGSNGYIMYKMTQHSNVITAASERPLVIPAPRIKPSSAEGIKYNMTIVTCAKIFENPPWLEEWLAYQRTLGVDHVHLDVEDTFQRRRGLDRPYMKKAMKEGFLSVDVWKKYLGMWELWYHNQGLIYEDCPYRFLGTYDYIVMLDTDDFFTPRKPDQMKLHYYINKFCRGKGIGSCKFRWVEYYPDKFGFSNVSMLDGNITRGIRNYSHYNQGNPKSLHRTTVLIDTATHYAFLMMPGYKIVDVPVNVAYVAHVRKNNRFPSKRDLVIGVPNTCSEHALSRLLLIAAIHLVFIHLTMLSGDFIIR